MKLKTREGAGDPTSFRLKEDCVGERGKVNSTRKAIPKKSDKEKRREERGTWAITMVGFI